MTTKQNKRTGLKGYIWLLMAVFCIVCSGATRWFIEQKANHNSYASGITPYEKRIKDHTRDKRQSLTATITSAQVSLPADDLAVGQFLLTTLISFALCYLFSTRRLVAAYALQPVPVLDRPLYLRDSRLQV